MRTWIMGYPRIGEKRELKFALERYWKGETAFDEVEKTAAILRAKHRADQVQSGANFVSVNDFSLYDNMLDTIVMLGLEPEGFKNIADKTERYFAMARGTKNLPALAMRKWFNTNYHYLVPELNAAMKCRVDTGKIETEYLEAKKAGINAKINLIGPVTFLLLSAGLKDPAELFNEVLGAYENILKRLSALDETVIVQLEEIAFAGDRTPAELSLLKRAYDRLGLTAPNVKIAVCVWFDHAIEAAKVLCETPVWAIGLDFVDGAQNHEIADQIAQSGKTLIAGLIHGRNIWRPDLDYLLEEAQELHALFGGDRLILATSCSLLHLPFSLEYETAMDAELKSWLAYAREKLSALELLKRKLLGDTAIEAAWLENRRAIESRKNSPRTQNRALRERMAQTPLRAKRPLPYQKRIELQRQHIGYGPLPTTTIGSFPQSADLREERALWRKGALSDAAYEGAIKKRIEEVVRLQEQLGFDVLVHGEFERNDMVEYFGEQLEGMAFSTNGWVQSYGSRCVKPPILYGDITRPKPMTVKWIAYAQSLTDRPMKGMLTGPVTMLNWSFVRDDQPKGETAMQMAYAIAEEIDDLQKAGIAVIQVDEAAFKEGYPLRSDKRREYEAWAVDSFVRSTAIAWDQTQIHTHMCYSDFNDIIAAIDALDADVITIETARNGNRLLDAFKRSGYPKEIGPGIYDIHSPRVPPIEEMEAQIKAILQIFPARQIWINPDCGLKTRGWPETEAALANLIAAADNVRKTL